MITPALFQHLSEHIGKAAGRPFRPRHERGVGGGCINRATVLEDGSQRYFVKMNNASQLAMFEAEARGLAELDSASAVRVPKPLCHGSAEGTAYLVLEYIPLRGGNGTIARRLGEQLARLHRHVGPSFGWDTDNTIGSTPQINTPGSDWASFFRDHRLGYQLNLAADHGYGGRLQKKGEALLAQVSAFFSDHRPAPSLLHGDLWGGNFAATETGEPVIFDPAVYYGDREADLAMTELFGGFPSDFYHAYRHAWPLDAGYDVRRDLYNLYHVLNHLNLFGGGYGGQAESLIERLLAEAH